MCDVLSCNRGLHWVLAPSSASSECGARNGGTHDQTHVPADRDRRILLLLAAAIGGCDERDEATDRARLEAMEAEIDRMIADRSCTGDGSCRVIAFGAKPCGGPWKFKIYSAENVDTLALQRSVEEYNEFNRELNERYNWISDCSLPPQLMAVCNQGECRGVLPTEPRVPPEIRRQ